jgi:hypothetical protein
MGQPIRLIAKSFQQAKGDVFVRNGENSSGIVFNWLYISRLGTVVHAWWRDLKHCGDAASKRKLLKYKIHTP